MPKEDLVPMHPIGPEALVAVEVEDRVVVIRRSPIPHSAQSLTAAYQWAIARAVERANTEALAPGLILDVRAAPGRNDPDFENELVDLHRQIEARFDPIVTLMRTSVGVLQATRLARQLGISDLIVQDHADAIALCQAR
ncbi:MAG: hypothetical protein ACE37F_23890 [Nannocystaceae bacterium]|nr:hypothetical protein [bacterium]